MTSSRRPVLPGPGGALALLLCLVYFTSIAWPMLGAIRGQPGIDFFQYWAVAGIRPTLPAGAVNPYAHTPEYERAIALSVLERGERDPLRILSARPHLDLTNTPLLYALASLLPALRAGARLAPRTAGRERRCRAVVCSCVRADARSRGGSGWSRYSPSHPTGR